MVWVDKEVQSMQ